MGQKAQVAAAVILALAVTVPAARVALPAQASAASAEALPARAATRSATPRPATLPTSRGAAYPVPTVPAASPTPAASAGRTAEQPLLIRRVLDTGGPIKYGTWFWDDKAASGGPLTITVDLKASVLSVFRGGDEIGTTAIIYGEDGRDTPLGTFPILQKDRHHVSNLYHAPMPYMLRLTRDGISIHASEVAYDYATHGCIGVPAGFARKLFDAAKLGDRVIVTNQGLRKA